MEIINSWKSEVKQWGKINIKVRIGRITLFDLYIDKPKKRYGVTLLNLGLKNNSKPRTNGRI
jgi:hypothetical protein